MTEENKVIKTVLGPAAGDKSLAESGFSSKQSLALPDQQETQVLDEDDKVLA